MIERDTDLWKFLNSEWAGRNPKRVLVTGGLGFIGSHFVALAYAMGMDVTVLDKITYAADKHGITSAVAEAKTGPRHEAKYGSVDFRNCDVADKELMLTLMRQTDAVVNFAAESHVDRSIDSVTPFIRTNVLGMASILGAAKTLGWSSAQDKVVLQVSTDEVYGSIDEGSFVEGDPPNPKNPYAVTKAAAEMMCSAFLNTFDVPYIITRGSNTYGERQYPEKIIPIFATRLRCGLKVTLFKGGEYNVRDWLHVDDHVAGIMAALLRGGVGETYNVAGRCEKTNMKLAETLIGALGGNPAERLGYIPDRPGHDYRYSIDSTKLEDIGWTREHGTHDWEQMVALTAKWYSENPGWWKGKTEWYLF